MKKTLITLSLLTGLMCGNVLAEPILSSLAKTAQAGTASTQSQWILTLQHLQSIGVVYLCASSSENLQQFIATLLSIKQAKTIHIHSMTVDGKKIFHVSIDALLDATDQAATVTPSTPPSLEELQTEFSWLMAHQMDGLCLTTPKAHLLMAKFNVPAEEAHLWKGSEMTHLYLSSFTKN